MHQSDEYSSLIESDFALKSFHNFTVDSTALIFARRSSCAVARNLKAGFHERG